MDRAAISSCCRIILNLRSIQVYCAGADIDSATRYGTISFYGSSVQVSYAAIIYTHSSAAFPVAARIILVISDAAAAFHRKFAASTTVNSPAAVILYDCIDNRQFAGRANVNQRTICWRYFSVRLVTVYGYIGKRYISPNFDNF